MPFKLDFTPTLIGRLLKAMQADKRSFVTLKDYFNGCQDSKVWEKYDYRDYGIIADPSFDIDYNEVFYITDTGRAWNNTSVSIRDKVERPEVGDRRSEVGGQVTDGRRQKSELIEFRTLNIKNLVAILNIIWIRLI
jgi:hypothetical protein